MNREAQKLLDWKEKIEEKKVAQIEAQARMKSILKEVKELYNCDTPEEMKDLIDSTTQEIQQLEAKLKRKIEKIEQKYPEL